MMVNNTKVTLYYGPLSWFEEELGDDTPRDYLLDIVNERDEARRRFLHIVPGQDVKGEDDDDDIVDVEPAPELLVTFSSDYASVQEHAISNFIGLIRDIGPKHLVLHNPPAQIHTQLDQVFSTDVKRFNYPTVTRETLVKFNDGFAAHLVGQHAVRERMLAALYPLTTKRRTTPMVLMLYGPSGVGKTETAQFVNGLLGGKLLRKQFSMFHSEKFASYLFGGVHTEASFARDLLDRSSGVILIDEFDKAHSMFHSAFYEVFDAGVFEDKNYRVELGPALIICTSNYGSEDDIRQALGDALFSRFDALIPFEPLSTGEIMQVMDRIVDSRLRNLDTDELTLVDVDATRELLHQNAQNIGNVRKLGKFIDEVISLKLVQAVLAEMSERRVSQVDKEKDVAE